ncbi:MAG: DUF87 domain-containing protein [bacterium]
MGLFDILKKKKPDDQADNIQTMPENLGTPEQAGQVTQATPKTQPNQSEQVATPTTADQVPDNQTPLGKKEIGNLSKEEAEAILRAEEIYHKGLVSVLDLISPGGLQLNVDFIRLNEKYVRTLFVFTYPRFLVTGWLSPIIDMNMAMDIAMYIHPVDTETILKTLRNKTAQVQSSISLEREKGKVRDPMMETALEDIEGLRDRLIQGTEKFFHYALYITIYEDTKEDLDKKTAEVENMLASHLIYAKKSVLQMEDGFTTTMPYGEDRLMIQNNMNTFPLSTSFPFTSAELTSDEGILYGINRHNNSLILFDRFTLPNANSVVFATSGAGKSYAVKLEILRSMMWGTDVIVIDPENEYKFLAEATGGSFLRIALNSDYRINPFDLPRAIGDEKPADVLRDATIQLKGLLGLMFGGMSEDEDGLVDIALTQTYASKDITPELESFADIEPPTMTDFQNVLESMDGTENLINRLKKYTEGTFSGLLNQPTNIDLNNQLVVFNVRDLEDELRPIAMYLIINYIWNIIRAEMKRRILTIDEAWLMMQHKDSALFMKKLAKRARKYYLGLTTISQDVNDFLNVEEGQAIVTNSSMQILLKQSQASIDILQRTFYLTDEEKYLLMESDVGEGIFFAGNKHVAIKIVASYQEDQIITTDPKQLMEIDKAKQEFAEAQSAGSVDGEANLSPGEEQINTKEEAASDFDDNIK